MHSLHLLLLPLTDLLKLPLSSLPKPQLNFLYPPRQVCLALSTQILSDNPNHNLKTPEIPQHDISLKFVKTVTIIIIFSLDDDSSNVKAVSAPSSSTPLALYIVVPLGECLNKQSKDMCY